LGEIRERLNELHSPIDSVLQRVDFIQICVPPAEGSQQEIDQLKMIADPVHKLRNRRALDEFPLKISGQRHYTSMNF
jgi:hypothetical protein